MVLILLIGVDVRELFAILERVVREDAGADDREDQLDAHGQKNVEIQLLRVL